LASKVLKIDIQKGYHSAKEDAKTILSIYKEVESDWIDDVSASSMQEMLSTHEHLPVISPIPKNTDQIETPHVNYPPSVTIDAWLLDDSHAVTPRLTGIPSQSTMKKTSEWIETIDTQPPAKSPRKTMSHTSPTVIHITDDEENYFTGEEELETIELRATVDLDFDVPSELEVFLMDETKRDGFQNFLDTTINVTQPIELSDDSDHNSYVDEYRRFEENRHRSNCEMRGARGSTNVRSQRRRDELRWRKY